jgi:hypothetical protein
MRKLIGPGWEWWLDTTGNFWEQKRDGRGTRLCQMTLVQINTSQDKSREILTFGGSSPIIKYVKAYTPSSFGD